MTKEAKIIAAISVLVGFVVIGSALLLGDSTGEKLSDTSALLRDYNYSTAATAKITLVEFADFQCPACASFNPVLKQVVEEYKDTVRLVYRHFPLPSHSNAKIAALASEAAGKQGKFWEMQALLYERQNQWSPLTDPRDSFEKFAQELSLNVADFKKSIDEKEFMTRINQDAQDGVKMGVNSTPTLFIDGEKYTGSINYQNLKKVIEDKLK